MVIWALTGLTAVTTVIFNLYIFLVSLHTYQEKKRWSSSEKIIVALSLTDIAHQLLCYFWMTLDEIDSECLVFPTGYTIILLLIFSLKFTIMWDSSFLTFYYSTKLVTTPNQCYTHIQATILKHVTLAIFLIPLCGLVTCMPMLVVFHDANDTATTNKDCGVLMPDTLSGQVYEILYLLLSDVAPGMLMIKCCISISMHLAIHLRNMKASTNGAHAPKFGSQMRVIQMSLSLVFIFLVFLVVDLYVNYQISVKHENVIVLTFFFTSIYTTASAAVLIYGKKTMWKMLIKDYNATLDCFPCLSRLKVSEMKPEPDTTKVKS
ncbi:taste receptor, type 2, member 202 [Neosynchiropus ocellatus]